MRCLIFILFGLVAVYAAPVAEENDAMAFMAELDEESHLAPMEDEETQLAKRVLSDEDLEKRKNFYDFVFDIDIFLILYDEDFKLLL